MSRDAYVNGRYLASAGLGEYRGPRLPIRRRRLRGHRRARARVDEEPHLDRLDRSLRKCASPGRWGAPRLAVHARGVRRNRVREGIVYMQVTRGVARATMLPHERGAAGAGRHHQDASPPDARWRRASPP